MGLEVEIRLLLTVDEYLAFDFGIFLELLRCVKIFNVRVLISFWI